MTQIPLASQNFLASAKRVRCQTRQTKTLEQFAQVRPYKLEMDQNPATWCKPTAKDWLSKSASRSNKESSFWRLCYKWIALYLPTLWTSGTLRSQLSWMNASLELERVLCHLKPLTETYSKLRRSTLIHKSVAHTNQTNWHSNFLMSVIAIWRTKTQTTKRRPFLFTGLWWHRLQELERVLSTQHPNLKSLSQVKYLASANWRLALFQACVVVYQTMLCALLYPNLTMRQINQCDTNTVVLAWQHNQLEARQDKGLDSRLPIHLNRSRLVDLTTKEEESTVLDLPILDSNEKAPSLTQMQTDTCASKPKYFLINIQPLKFIN